MVNSIRIAKKWEYASAILSTLWCGFCIAVMVMLLVLSENTREYVSFSLYGSFAILFYIFSSIYYFLPNHKSGKLIFSHITHCFFILFLLGIYIPFCLLIIKGNFGLSILSVAGGLSVIGIIFRAIKGDLWKSYLEWIYYTAFVLIWTLSIPKMLHSVNEDGVIIYIVATLILIISMVFFRISTKMQKRKAMAYRFVFNVLFILSQICHIIFMFLFIIRNRF